MTKDIILATIIIFFIFFRIESVDAQSKIHDFDSLLEHNESFKAIASQIGDTLDLFNSSEPLKIVFESDFKNLVKRKFKEEYQDARFTVMYNDTVKVTRDLQIKARGNVRKSTCHMPPIKLNFPKDEAFIQQLKHFDKLKMVLDCKRSDLYEQYLLLEYYAYKILNLITEYSVRVRLLEVTYIDLSGRYKQVTKFAFILESVDQLNLRLNTIRIENKGVRDMRTDLKVLADAYLFQYLIGNTDWSIPGLHNVYILKSMDPTKISPYVIPYDFDYAGIVNTNYAVPDENLGTKTVRERVYRGVCITSNEMYQARERFIAKKQEIYDLYNHDTYLSRYSKNSTLGYIDDFYQIIENENSFERYIIDACR